MIPTNAILILSGIVCVYFTWFAIRRLIPREGRTVPAWTSSDAGAATVAVGLISLALIGAGLILKGLLG
jgi:hypothetical protein